MRHILSFKPLDRYNLEYIRLLRNDNRQYFLDKSLIGPTKHLKWYREKYRGNPLDVIFIVKDFWANENLGMCSIYDLDMINQTCKIGRFIVEKKMRGFGIGEKMVDFCIGFAIEVFKVRGRILLEVRAKNKSAIGLYEEKGFIETRSNRGIIYMERGIK